MNHAFKKELLLGLVVLALLAALPLLSPGRVTLDFVIRLAALGVFATSLNILVGYGGWCLLVTPCFLAAALIPLAY